MDVAGILIIGVLAAVVVVSLTGRRESAKRARLLRGTGFGFMGFFVGVFGAFIVAETINDPGGWKGAGLVASWLVPLVILALMAWLRPNLAGWILIPLVAIVVGLSIWFAIDPVGWRSFENRNGPVRVVLTFALSAPLALWGLRQTMQAALSLLILGVLPAVIAAFAGRGGMASLAVASFAPIVTGVLYLSAAYQDRRQPPPGEVASPANPRAA